MIMLTIHFLLGMFVGLVSYLIGHNQGYSRGWYNGKRFFSAYDRLNKAMRMTPDEVLRN